MIAAKLLALHWTLNTHPPTALEAGKGLLALEGQGYSLRVVQHSDPEFLGWRKKRKPTEQLFTIYLLPICVKHLVRYSMKVICQQQGAIRTVRPDLILGKWRPGLQQHFLGKCLL